MQVSPYIVAEFIHC